MIPTSPSWGRDSAAHPPVVQYQEVALDLDRALHNPMYRVVPFGEKLIAPEMQCIVHAVVFKTRGTK